MSDRMDHHRDMGRYRRGPRYQLDDDAGSGWRIWALVALIAGGVLVIALASGYGNTTVEHPGGATAISAPAAPDGGDGTREPTLPQSIMAPDR